MKRYLVFGGSCYYPAGGWKDFIGDADTPAEAYRMTTEREGDWFHVVDTQEPVLITDEIKRGWAKESSHA